MAPSRPRTSRRRSEPTRGDPAKSGNPSRRRGSRGAALGLLVLCAIGAPLAARAQAQPGARPDVRARRDGHARLRRRRARAGDRDDRARDQPQLHLRRPRARPRDDRLARADPGRAGLRGVRVGAPGEGLHHRHDARRRDQGGPGARGEGVEHRDGAQLAAPAEPRHVRHAPDPAALHRRRLDRQHAQAARLEGRGDGRLRADQHGDPDRVGLEHPAPDRDPRVDRRRDLQGRPRRHQRRVRRRRDARRSGLGDLRRRGGRGRRRVRVAPRRAPPGRQSAAIRTRAGRPRVKPPVRILTDERTNSLLVLAPRAQLEEVRRLVAKLDVPVLGRRPHPRLLPEERQRRGARRDARRPGRRRRRRRRGSSRSSGGAGDRRRTPGGATVPAASGLGGARRRRDPHRGRRARGRHQRHRRPRDQLADHPGQPGGLQHDRRRDREARRRAPPGVGRGADHGAHRQRQPGPRLHGPAPDHRRRRAARDRVGDLGGGGVGDWATRRRRCVGPADRAVPQRHARLRRRRRRTRTGDGTRDRRDHRCSPRPNGDINIVSAPHILTSDNEEAEIRVGNNIPIISSRVQSAAGIDADTASGLAPSTSSARTSA